MVKKDLRSDAVECQICKASGTLVAADSLITHLSYHHPGVSFAEYEKQFGPAIAPSLRAEFGKKTVDSSV